MIRFIENKDINRKKWDRCIASSSLAPMFVLSWYLDAVAPDWCAVIQGDYEAVFPLATKIKYRIGIIYQPFFTRYYGLYGKNEDRDIQPFLDKIPGLYRKQEFSIHENNLFNGKGYEAAERHFQWIDLSRSAELITKQYSENARRSVKKALKAAYTVKSGVAPERIISLFRITKGDELEVFSAKDYKMLSKLMEEFLSRGQAETYEVTDANGETVSAAFFMQYRNRYVYLKSGVTAEGRSNGAMYLLIDHFIRLHAGSPVVLDFGGSSVDSVARFYKKFGAEDSVYLHLKKDRLPSIVKWVKKLK